MTPASLRAAIEEVASRDPVLAGLVARVGYVTHRPRDPGLTPESLSAVPDAALRAERRGNLTVLSGVLADQPALHGVLSQIEALGLELLEVRRLPPT